MKEVKEKVFYQKYKIHLVNGEVLEHWEEFYLPDDAMDLTEWFESADDDEILTIGESLFGYKYIPRRSIVYIAQNGVAWDWIYKRGAEEVHIDSEEEYEQ